MTAVLLETVRYLPEPVDTLSLPEQGTAYWPYQAETNYLSSGLCRKGEHDSNWGWDSMAQNTKSRSFAGTRMRYAKEPAQIQETALHIYHIIDHMCIAPVIYSVGVNSYK